MRPEDHTLLEFDPNLSEWTCSCGLIFLDDIYGGHCPNTPTGQDVRRRLMRLAAEPPNTRRIDDSPSQAEINAAIASIQGAHL